MRKTVMGGSTHGQHSGSFVAYAFACCACARIPIAASGNDAPGVFESVVPSPAKLFCSGFSVAVFEMKRRIKALRMQGLPESPE